MAINLFDVSATLDIDSSLYNSALKDAETKASKLVDNLNKQFKKINLNDFGKKLDKGLSKLNKGIAVTAGAFTAFTTLAVKQGLSFNASIESATTDFEVLLGDYDKAVKKVAELKAISSKTPFELTDLTSATKTLLAFNVESEKTTEILTQLGDISLGDAQKLESLTRAFGKMNASQKVTLEDINIMIGAGFNPLLLIAEKTGETMTALYDRLGKGGVSVNEMTEAFKKATSAGGQFYQGMQKASTTTKGLMSTLKDNINTLEGTLVKPVSDIMQKKLLPSLIENIGKFQNWLDENPEKLDALAVTLNNLATKGINLVIDGMQWIIDNGDQLSKKILAIVSTFTACYGAVKLLAGLLTHNYFDMFIGGSMLAITAIGNLIEAFRNLKKEAGFSNVEIEDLSNKSDKYLQDILDKSGYLAWKREAEFSGIDTSDQELIQRGIQVGKFTQHEIELVKAVYTEQEARKAVKTAVEDTQKAIENLNTVATKSISDRIKEVEKDAENITLLQEKLVSKWKGDKTATQEIILPSIKQDNQWKVKTDIVFDVGLYQASMRENAKKAKQEIEKWRAEKTEREQAEADAKAQEQFEKWNPIVNNVTETFGKFFSELATGEATWKDFGKVALSTLAEILKSLGAQLSALAVTKALTHDWVGASLATAGAIGAYTASGLASAKVSSSSSSVSDIPTESITATSQPIILEVDGKTLGKFTYDAYNKQNRRVGVVLA